MKFSATNSWLEIALRRQKQWLNAHKCYLSHNSLGNTLSRPSLINCKGSLEIFRRIVGRPYWWKWSNQTWTGCGSDVGVNLLHIGATKQGQKKKWYLYLKSKSHEYIPIYRRGENLFLHHHQQDFPSPHSFIINEDTLRNESKNSVQFYSTDVSILPSTFLD